MIKGIAIQTVLLILIGVIVIGIMAYLVYKGATTKTLSVFECKAKLIDICRMCGNTNWDIGYPLDDTADSLFKTTIEPCSKYSEFFQWWDNKCCGDNPPLCKPCGCMKGDCNTLMGTTA